MTQWVENPSGGRDRGPVALVRAWGEVLVRPRRFFHNGVAPGDQAPGLVFAGTVVLVAEATRVLVATFSTRGLLGTGPFEYPFVAGLGPLGAVLYLLAAVVFVAPLALHLTAAVQTLLLAPLAPDRGGISETVQVLGYATAPCVFAGVALPSVRVVCAVWGSALYVIGTSEVHDLSIGRAAVLGAVPAAIVFGYGFRGFLAVGTYL